MTQYFNNSFLTGGGDDVMSGSVRNDSQRGRQMTDASNDPAWRQVA